MKKIKHPISLNAIYWGIHIILVLLILGTIHFGFKMTQNLLVYLEFKDQGGFEIESIDYGLIWTQNIITGLIKIVLYFFVLIFFRRFIHNVREGFTFYDYNLKNLKKLAYVLIFIGLIEIIEYFFISSYTPYLERTMLLFTFIRAIGWKFILGICAWVFAHVFEIGILLQRDKDLTI